MGKSFSSAMLGLVLMTNPTGMSLTFNRKTDSVQINGYKPFKTPRNSALTPEQKKYNKHLSQMRVVVENTIARVKQWKIMKGVFRHFRNGKGKLDINHILTAKSKSIQFEVANG
jgi:hypothetical protein